MGELRGCGLGRQWSKEAACLRLGDVQVMGTPLNTSMLGVSYQHLRDLVWLAPNITTNHWDPSSCCYASQQGQPNQVHCWGHHSQDKQKRKPLPLLLLTESFSTKQEVQVMLEFPAPPTLENGFYLKGPQGRTRQGLLFFSFASGFWGRSGLSLRAPQLCGLHPKTTTDCTRKTPLSLTLLLPCVVPLNLKEGSR